MSHTYFEKPEFSGSRVPIVVNPQGPFHVGRTAILSCIARQSILFSLRYFFYFSFALFLQIKGEGKIVDFICIQICILSLSLHKLWIV